MHAKQSLIFVILFFGVLAVVSGLTAGYTTAPLLSEELLVREQTRTELSSMGWPTPIGGLYLRDRIQSSAFGWYSDMTFGKTKYEAAANSKFYNINLAYFHQEVHYYIAANPTYFIGGGFEYIYMTQSLPSGSAYTTYTTTHGFPVLCIGTDVVTKQLNIGLKYTHRLFTSEFTNAIGTGELSIQLGLKI